MRDPRAF